MIDVAIIDYGAGNLASAARAIETLGARTRIVADPAAVGDADRLLLPGVGSFAAGMERLRAAGWDEALHRLVGSDRVPLLGICLGMQLLGTASPEGGGTTGFGFIAGAMHHLADMGCNDRIPHVGWNEVSVRDDGGMFAGIPDRTDFYFVHSYAFVANDPADIAATVHYGIDVTAAIARGCVWGAQFHPEKSSKMGLKLLRNFIDHDFRDA